MDNNELALEADRIAEQCILELEKLFESWNKQLDPIKKNNLKIGFKQIIYDELKRLH